MHELILLICIAVLMSCKSCQTFSEHINTQRVNAGYNNIDSQVKFMSVD